MSTEKANDMSNMENLEKEIIEKQESNGANSSKDENKEKTKDDGGFLSKIKNLFKDEEIWRFLLEKFLPENKDKSGFWSKIKNAIKNADFWWFFSTKMIFAYLPLMVYVLWKYLSGTNFADVLLSESIFLSLN